MAAWRRALVGARRYAASDAHAEIATPAHKAQLGNTIGYYVSAQARRLGHHNAFRVPFQGVNWTYIDVQKNCHAFALGLNELGVRAGDRILSIQPGTAEAFMTQAAAAKIGAVCVNISPYTANVDTIADALDKYQPRVVVVREFCDIPGKKGSQRKSVHEMLHQTIPEMDQLIGNMFVKSPKYPSVRSILVADGNYNLPGTRPVRETCIWGPFSYYECRLRRVACFISPDHPGLILPRADGKDVVFSHRNIMTAAYHTAQVLGMKNDSPVMLAPQTNHLPLFHLAHYSALAAGSTLSYGAEHLHDGAHIGKFLENLELEKVQGLFIAKEQLDLLLPTVKGQGVGEHLKWILVANDAPIPAAYANDVKAAFGVDTVHIFDGPLETASALNMTTVNGKGAQAAMLPNTQLRVVGDQGGPQAKTLGRGKVGALRAKGPGVATQYWHYGGLMENDVDVMGYFDLEHDATITDSGAVENIVRRA